jgi:hypothetical protein
MHMMFRSCLAGQVPERDGEQHNCVYGFIELVFYFWQAESKNILRLSFCFFIFSLENETSIIDYWHWGETLALIYCYTLKLCKTAIFPSFFLVCSISRSMYWSLDPILLDTMGLTRLFLWQLSLLYRWFCSIALGVLADSHFPVVVWNLKDCDTDRKPCCNSRILNPLPTGIAHKALSRNASCMRSMFTETNSITWELPLGAFISFPHQVSVILC